MKIKSWIREIKCEFRLVLCFIFIVLWSRHFIVKSNEPLPISFLASILAVASGSEIIFKTTIECCEHIYS